MNKKISSAFITKGPQSNWSLFDRVEASIVYRKPCTSQKVTCGPDDSFCESGAVLCVTDGWVAADNVNLKNLTYTFCARAPKEVPQVQIWAGFRHYSRDYRYVVALRGGSNHHLYLARMGAEGYDKMLALRPLEWSPTPGMWYQIKVVAAGTRIAVWAGTAGEAFSDKPLICVEDEDAPFTAGSVALGGSFLPTEFCNVTISPAAVDALDGVSAQPNYLASVTPSSEEKAMIRRRERAAYRPFDVPTLPEEHMELSLNGRWLFVPDYELGTDPQSISYDDTAAHVIQVPSSWIPLQAWLEGENMRDLNKGMNDDYLVEEMIRCGNQTFDWRRTQSGWYRHYLDLPCGIEQKQVVLDFEAIALISAVYVNGMRVNENIGMFAPQTIDISSAVHAGRNVLAVEVYRRLSEESEHAVSTASIDDNYATAWDILDEEGIETRCERRAFCTDDIAHGFYMNNPGGIWRNVRLIIRNKIHIMDCFFQPSLTDAAIQVTVQNSGTNIADSVLSYSLAHRTTGEYLCGGIIDHLTLQEGETQELTIKTPRVSPRLWGPGTPNLYTLTFTLTSDDNTLDTYCEQVGFRTVKAEGNRLLYNGEPLWVRGGNHMPAHVRPNDRDLANTFMRLALSHNCIATRTHVAPWGSTWLDAADEAGLLVSLEGTWSWLMLEHIPSKRSIELWKTEFEKILRRHRNRPSLFLVTMNNEMKFYLHEAPDEVVTEKGYILEGGVRMVRSVLPHLPLVCDSAYFRKQVIHSGRYERIIQAHGFDDGDVDDPHGYFGWYNPDFFHFMNGEFGRDHTLPDRPCLSQECATGYPRAEDGLPTRAYLYLHQTPQTTVGKKAYEMSDPVYFLSRHAMLTKEMAEVLRRVEHDRTCGVMLFAFETWFYHQHDARRIQPMLSARCLRQAYEPVLASAELFGRHFQEGQTLVSAVTLINDANDHHTLRAPKVKVTIEAEGTVLAAHTLVYADLPYYETAVKMLDLSLPDRLPADRMKAQLVLRVFEENTQLSRNEYELLLATQRWSQGKLIEKSIEGSVGKPMAMPLDESMAYLAGDQEAARLLMDYKIPAKACTSLHTVAPNRLLIVGALSDAQAMAVRSYAEEGGRVLLLGQGTLPDALLGEGAAVFTAHRQEIVTMNMAESAIFDGIEPLDLAWFSAGRQIPYVAEGRYTLDRFRKDLYVLAETLEWHGYINQPTDYTRFGGTPLFVARIGKGSILVSALRMDAETDPVARRLTGNILKWDFDLA